MALKLPDVAAAQQQNRSNSLQLISAIGQASAQAFAQQLTAKRQAFQALSEASAMQVAASNASLKFAEDSRQFDARLAESKAARLAADVFKQADDNRLEANAQASMIGKMIGGVQQQQLDNWQNNPDPDDARAVNERLQKQKDGLISGYGEIGARIGASDELFVKNYNIDNGGQQQGSSLSDPSDGREPSSGLLGDNPGGEAGEYTAASAVAERAEEMKAAGLNPGEVFDALVGEQYELGDIRQGLGLDQDPAAVAEDKNKGLSSIFEDMQLARSHRNNRMMDSAALKMRQHPRIQGLNGKIKGLSSILDGSSVTETGLPAKFREALRGASSLTEIEDLEQDIDDAIETEKKSQQREQDRKSGKDSGPTFPMKVSYAEAKEENKTIDDAIRELEVTVNNEDLFPGDRQKASEEVIKLKQKKSKNDALIKAYDETFNLKTPEERAAVREALKGFRDFGKSNRRGLSIAAPAPAPATNNVQSIFDQMR